MSTLFAMSSPCIIKLQLIMQFQYILRVYKVTSKEIFLEGSFWVIRVKLFKLFTLFAVPSKSSNNWSPHIDCSSCTILIYFYKVQTVFSANILEYLFSVSTLIPIFINYGAFFLTGAAGIKFRHSEQMLHEPVCMC